MSTSSKLGSKATHSSKATNAGAVLELLKDVGKIGESVPYLEAVAGLLKTIIEMKQVRIIILSGDSLKQRARNILRVRSNG